MYKNSIKLLPQSVANRIAAGEVIERPASMLKELLENAIDSGATNIDVNSMEGGTKLLAIEDNGSGINFDELPLSLTHHATSKISSLNDLDAISTLGFRGEALASISDVSHIEIISKTKDSTSGGKIVSHGGKIIEHTPHAYVNGTKITVKNLFYNLPARFKFLKTNSREFFLLKEVFEASALANHNISMSIKNADRMVSSYKKVSCIRERVLDYLGLSPSNDNLIEVEITKETFSVYLLCSDTSVMQATRKNNFLFLNGRPIENRGIAYSIKNAYTGVIPREKYPYYFAYITINYEKVDVNVHPSKKEVRIKNEREISGSIYNAIRREFEKMNKLVTVDLNSDIENNHHFNVTNDYNSFFSQSNYGNNESESFINRVNSDFNSEASILNDYNKESIELNINPNLNEQVSNFGASTRALGQVFSSYILAERMDEMYIIDQHAAYERLNYERIYKTIVNKKLEYEKLLIPLELEYRDYEIDILIDGKENLNSIGIYFEMNSKTSIIIEDIPLYLPKTTKIDFIIKDIFDNYISKDSTDSLERLIKSTCNTIACKYSPKAGDRLSIGDMQKLIYLLESENILTSCPHGRPFILRISKNYLDNKFLR